MEPMFVKVHSGWGQSGLWKITGKDSQHYNLTHVASGEKKHLYKAHTYEDQESKRAGFDTRKALAGKFAARR